ncbi:hypothetical protein RN001_012874 [Aquatica leii]|uniref:ABC transporter domain-containing protein n=1 Tax=Aquatica leii TaxID=1421715 RepID=A0AAN7SDJ5_9COLE|nr:hypothetical protein RN001_012874 [Aquatica leii]
MEESQNEYYPPTILVQRACKQYMFKKVRFSVLDHLNMTVPRGCIYGLLGASGCGKTTLLNCILNFKKIDSGKILVFGGVPGTKQSGISSPRVGYMPQELALGPNLSIREALKFFGWIAGMSFKSIDHRTKVLAKLLALPDLSHRIINLSGGQQRRVSLACTLIHEPDLLILDEPTVGLESILRKDIWDYLQELSKKLITIIITTHYIEETRQASIVGFMREGSILTEDSPNNVLMRFNEQSLEKVFLKLSVMQNSDQNQRTSNKVGQTVMIGLDDVDAHSMEINKHAQFSKRDYHEKLEKVVDPKKLKRMRIKAILWKHSVWMRQNYKSVIFIIFLTFFQTCFFCLTVGHNPTYIPVAAYNSETINCKESVASMECNSSKLGCVFLTYLDNSIYKVIYHTSEKSAIKSVSLGKTYAAITIKQNYSNSLRNRIKKWVFANSYDLDQSEISATCDHTNAEVSEYVILYLYKNFQTFIQDYLESCKLKRRVMSYPVRIEKAIYGANDPDFTQYFLPGFISTLIMCLGITIMTTSILTERKIGDLERNQVVGVTVNEVVLAYCITELVMLTILITVILFTVFFVFDAVLEGSLGLVVSLSIASGLCGMSYGLFVAALCETETAALFMSLGCFLPLMMFSGVVWPIQGMHIYLQWVAYAFPVSTTSEALRNIMVKGWGLDEAGVYKGFIVLPLWMLIFFILFSIALKFFKTKLCKLVTSCLFYNL